MSRPILPLRSLAFRPRPRCARLPLTVRNASEMNNSDKLPHAQQGQPGPNTQQQEHVSEEAAKMAKIQGGSGPDMEAGTPVQEILQEEPEQREQAPEVLKEQVKQPNPTANTKPSTSTRHFSTYARRGLDLQSSASSTPPLPPSMLPTIQPPASTEATTTGHKFPLPVISTIVPKDKRQEDIITQLTNLLMRDGKKSVAQHNMSVILTYLRTAPAPTYSNTRNLLPGAPAASHLPLNPVMYLTLAVDSVAPLLRIRSQRGAAGGGVALQIPVPLGLRQRRRTAWTWILDAASKRQSRGSGRDMFPTRVAQEVVAVVEGKSGVWEKRQAVHRLSTAARVNVGFRTPGFRR